MRARNLKPSIFKNEHLARLGPECYRAFTGLWCLADRKGRLEDRPDRIEAELFPFKFQSIDMNQILDELAMAKEPFIIRYEFEKKRYIQIVNFEKHQWPHHREQESGIPAPVRTRSRPRLARLNPSILNPSILNREGSPNGESVQLEEPKEPRKETDLQKIVKGWKMLNDIPIEGPESKAWDKVHFARVAKSAQSLLGLFGFEEAINCMEFVFYHFKKIKMDCTIETIVKRSDLFREQLAGRGK
jgi:hypothetical protein